MSTLSAELELPVLRQHRSGSSQQSSQDTLPISDPASSFSDCALISSPLSAPSNLRKTLDGRYVYYDDNLHVYFQEWWELTKWGSDMTIGRHPHCVRWNSSVRHSPTWSAFEQVAHVKTGEPFICCKQCLKLLKHPTTNNSGMTAPKKHTESSNCRRKRKPGSQPILDAMLTSVRSPIPPYNWVPLLVS